MEDQDVLTGTTQTMTIMDIVERVPPSIMQLLVALGPLINVFHRFLVIATWRGGYTTRMQSWLLLLCCILVCLYGYETLRYAPQAVILVCIGYSYLSASYARVAGNGKLDGQGATTQSVKKTIAQLGDISDFVVALRETVFDPLFTLLQTRSSGMGVRHLVIFLLVTWPLWLLCVIPANLWFTNFVTLRTSAGAVLKSEQAQAVRAYMYTTVLPSANEFAYAHAPKLHAKSVQYAPHMCKYIVQPALWAAHHLVHAMHYIPLSLQTFPPFPIASFSVRHIFLVLVCILLTWCSPWATMLRLVLWRSALVRHLLIGFVNVCSGTENIAEAWRNAMPKRYAPPKLVQSKNMQSYETVFEFAVYENQRWWIGLDWTAALLPQERPSWADVDSNAVAPPASFSLPGAVRTFVASSIVPGKEDCRTAVWRWVEPEWHVLGAQSITSSVHTPSLAASSAPEMHTDAMGHVLDAADRANAAAAAEAAQSSLTKTEQNAMQSSEAELPEALKTVVRAAASARDPLDVDAQGWQYGDNAWEKMSSHSGVGRYTRRRCWIRRAVLVETVERGVRKSQ
ncbi:hypothetical protein MVES1_000074 [Malassezia vespertilionis]|uniref:Peroxin/Ferlin domain-containing protein n=1 Tax=Malassezia vespertilionis TaxID=2020962 RepID=A0A2N1JG26_9BASI|nr:uncharacterized protein MVES1_000074 [Malassezia vespertilionis]PKI85489.1 hypothetical protein MVES_000069 [Malassezia vespertilionis]WFD04750.1 hypothetical protein MVES1_000074 [Malassezia vespertilionis]